MKILICQQGSLSFDGETYNRGQKFDAEDDMAKHLLGHRLATEYISRPIPQPTLEQDIMEEDMPEQAPEPEETAEEIMPDPAALEDLSLLNIQEVKEVIDDTNNPDTIQAYMEAELAGKNRKTVLEALESKSTV